MNTADIKRILIPTDLSDFASLAIQYGAFFNRRLGAALTLLYADEMLVPFGPEVPMGYFLENAPAARKQEMEMLCEQARKYAPGIDVETVVISDTPSRAIVTTADKMNADLILMGTHGRHGVERAFLGSVAERVLRQTDRPVLTVAPPLFPQGKEAAIRTVLCPVNFTPIAGAALNYAAKITDAFHAELVMLYVDDGTHSPFLNRAGAELAAWIAPAVRERIRYREVLTRGDAAARVLEVADDVDTDLIVIGSQHKLFSDATVFGTTTERITRFAKRPVLTVTLKPPARETVTKPFNAAVAG